MGIRSRVSREKGGKSRGRPGNRRIGYAVQAYMQSSDTPGSSFGVQEILGNMLFNARVQLQAHHLAFSNRYAFCRLDQYLRWVHSVPTGDSTRGIKTLKTLKMGTLGFYYL